VRRFSGAGGILYALGERLCFSDVPLASEDGWDWTAPEDLSYWLTDPLEFRVTVNGEWIRFDPVEIFHETGRVGFTRNLFGSTVLASGVCLPCSRVGESRHWELIQDTVMSDLRSFDGGHAIKVVGFEAKLESVQVPIKQVMCRLPTGGNGMFIGVGEAVQAGPDAIIRFEKEGVSYGLR
jgi:hypothetical protein